MKHIYKTIISVFLILVLASAVVVTTAKENPSVQNSLGLTDIQIQKAKEVTIKEFTNTTDTKTTQDTQERLFSGNTKELYMQICCIEDEYYGYINDWNANNYLNIPIKAEVWDKSLNPVYNARVFSRMFYWDYNTERWEYYSPDNTKYTDRVGQVKFGYSIPITHDSDLYYIYMQTTYGSKTVLNYKFFRIYKY